MPLTDILFTDAVERLRAATQEDRPIEAAQMHLINLQEIIRRAGAHWPLIKDQIRIGSLKFLKGCLADEDIVIPAGDGFLVIFAQGDTGELQARAEDLRALLLEFYMGQQTPMRDLQVTVEHKTMASRELGALVARPSKPQAAPASKQCLFAPAWFPGAQVIASYFCVPAHQDFEGMRYGYDRAYAETGALDHRDYAQLDIAMLDAIEDALTRTTGDTQPGIGVSVHSTTMQNRAARAAFLDRLARMPPDLMKFLTIKIAEIEPGAPLINLADWAGMLRARVRTILLEHHHSEQMPPDLSEVGVWGAGFQLPNHLSEVESAALVRQLARWGESLARQRKRFFVDNARKAHLAKAAVEAGAAFITSGAFWPYKSAPGGVVSAPAPFPGPQKSLSSATT